MKTICHIGPGQPVHHMRIFHRICWSQVKAGYHVAMIAHQDAETHTDGMHIHDLGSRQAATLRWNLWSRLQRNFKAYSLARGMQADLYFFYSPEFVPFALLLKWLSGKPVVFDCMEDFVGYAQQHSGIPKRLRGTVAFMIGKVFGIAARQLDFITVADQGTAAQFLKHTPKVLTLYNFPRLDLFPPAASYAFEKREFDLVYHGTNHRNYLELLLEIDQQLLALGVAAHWYIFGTFAELAWFRGAIALQGAEHRFVIGGLVPHVEVFKEVQRACIGIIPLPALPKYLNNIPQKLFEFMALEMPVVLSDLPPSRPFVAESEAAIMVDPDSALAYAMAIKQLLTDPASSQAMGRRGRKLVAQRWNWDSEAEKLALLVKSLLEQQVNTDAVQINNY